MADFGDYAGQYLTMARDARRMPLEIARTESELATQAAARPGIAAQSSLLQEQVPYGSAMARAKLEGTPFEQRGQQITMLGQERQNRALEQQLLYQQENQRRQHALEESRIRQEKDQSAINNYNAALKAYEAGIGPNPGPAPGTVRAGGGGATTTPTGPAVSLPPDLMKLPPGARNKIWAERLADQPQAVTKIEGLTTTLDQMIDEAKQLQGHAGMTLGSGYTGTVMRNLPDLPTTAPGEGTRNFGERLKSLGAQIGFNALSQMREMSKTGGALGQVSDFENKRLEAAISALDAQQNPEDIKRALRQVTNYAEAAKKNMAAAYKRTYGEDLPKLEKREVVPPNAGEAAPAAQSAPAEPTATGPNGQKVVFRNGQWMPL